MITNAPSRVHRSHTTRIWKRNGRYLLHRIAAIFVQGLIGLLPLIVTVVVLGWLGYAAEQILGTAIQYVIPETWYIGGMGLLVGVIFVFIFGLLINVYGVPRLINIAEAKIGRVPLVKTIYGAVRDLLSFFARTGEDGAVNQVVVVTFGDSGIKAVGLLMRDTYEDLPEGLGGEDYTVVYFPQSYQLGGMLLLVPKENITPLDMKLEDALRFIITAGAKAAATPGPPRGAAPGTLPGAPPGAGAGVLAGAVPIQDPADLPPGTPGPPSPRR